LYSKIENKKILADNYYKLGNAYYNISYWGPCSKTIDYYHSNDYSNHYYYKNITVEDIQYYLENQKSLIIEYQ